VLLPDMQAKLLEVAAAVLSHADMPAALLQHQPVPQLPRQLLHLFAAPAAASGTLHSSDGGSSAGGKSAAHTPRGSMLAVGDGKGLVVNTALQPSDASALASPAAATPGASRKPAGVLRSVSHKVRGGHL
jgi:hypothetical protein